MASPLPLHICFIPFIGPGHFVPLTEVARLFAARGHHVTVITTTTNAARITSATTPSGGMISAHVIPFPAKEVGLPEGCENDSMAELDNAMKLHRGIELMRPEIERAITTRRPDCIVSDGFYPWTTDFAASLRIPRLVFDGFGIFAKAMHEALRKSDSPHLQLESDYDPFVVPGIPHPVTFTRSQLPTYLRSTTSDILGLRMLNEIFREAESKSYGVLVNSFAELDSVYIEYYTKIMGHKAFHVGPSMLTIPADNKDERSQKSVLMTQAECSTWLDSKPSKSVLYICFGSRCEFSDSQLMEIACGLEAAGHDFIWVVLGKSDKDKDEDIREEEGTWLPIGFKERVMGSGKGMIVRGWAPQLLILGHPSTGGFLTHCGWNSVVEAVASGVPMLTWPLYAEQFFNEKLVTQVLGVGLEVGSLDWCVADFEAGKGKVIGRGEIERGVRKLMAGGDDQVKEMRKKCKELGDEGKRAVEQGGSSYENLTTLIEELKALRHQKLALQ